MAGQEELDKFVRKFVSLWQSGCEARVHVETKAGNAFVNLKVGLGQVKTLTETRVSMQVSTEVVVLPSNAVESVEKQNARLELQLRKLLMKKSLM